MPGRHLTIGLEHEPGNWRLSDTMALDTQVRSGKLKEAETCLRRGLETPGDREGHSRLRWVLADVLIDEGKWTPGGEGADRSPGHRIVSFPSC